MLVSLLATGIWLLSRRYDTNFWPGFIMLLLLIPLGLHAAVVLSGPARAPAEERRLVTVLFCDLVDFTARSDQADPEDVGAMLRPYHARQRAEIERRGGLAAIALSHPHYYSGMADWGARFDCPVEPWTSSSATPSWPCSAPPWPTRTTPSGPSAAPWACWPPSRS